MCAASCMPHCGVQVFSKVGDVKRIVMGLDKHKSTPCGFCFVVYYTREDTEDCVKYINGTMLDDRPIRVDFDWGFVEGRQFGRGRSGGQVCAQDGWLAARVNPFHCCVTMDRPHTVPECIVHLGPGCTALPHTPPQSVVPAPHSSTVCTLLLAPPHRRCVMSIEWTLTPGAAATAPSCKRRWRCGSS